MRWCDAGCARFAVAFQASGNLKAFLVNRDRYQPAPGDGEYLTSQPVGRLFNPHRIARIKQYARGNLQSLLRAADDHDLARVAVYAARCSQIFGNRCAKLQGAHRVAEVKRADSDFARVPRHQLRPHLKGKVVERQLSNHKSTPSEKPRRGFEARKKL